MVYKLRLLIIINNEFLVIYVISDFDILEVESFCFR